MISRLWSISVLIEPLLLFALSSGTGIGSNVSRIFQFLVLIIFCIHLLSNMNFRFLSTGSYLWKPYLLIIGYIIIVTCASYLLGGYNMSLSDDAQQSNLEIAFGSNDTRPALEFVILIFQLLYFIILAPIFLKSRKNFNFFFKCAFFLLFCHFALGWIDYILNLTGIDLIPRQLVDGVDVGGRFHGIAGEPKQAGVYGLSIFFLLSIYSLYKNGSVKWPRWYITLLVLTSCIATGSASFLVGLSLGGILVLCYLWRRKSIKLWLGIILGLSAVALSVIYNLHNNATVIYYINQYSPLLRKVVSDPQMVGTLTYIPNINDIFPLVSIWQEVTQGDIFRLIFGSGIGSSGLVNSTIYGHFTNPNSQAVRIIYEYGIIGVGIYILTFLEIIKRCSAELPSKERDILIISALILLGGVLGHRSNVHLIWIGLLCAVTVYRRRNESIDKGSN